MGSEARIALAGSGSSLAGPVFAVWQDAFNRQYSSIRVGYIPTSSGEGIRQITLLLGDFAVGEIPLSHEQLNNPTVHLTQLPIAVMGVVPIYNVPVSAQLRFTGELLAQVYMGNVANWSDSRIAILNPGVRLPNLPIVSVRRPRGSGTRYIFTQFLSQRSHEFRSWIEDPQHAARPDMTAAVSKDMVERVALTPGAIGYVERTFALHSGVAVGRIQNRSGKFVEASEASIGATCKAMEKLIPDDFVVSMFNAEGEKSYPLVGFVWVYVPVSGLAPERRDALQQFLNWSLDEGQALLAGKDYLPLSGALAKRAQAKLQSTLLQ